MSGFSVHGERLRSLLSLGLWVASVCMGRGYGRCCHWVYEWLQCAWGEATVVVVIGSMSGFSVHEERLRSLLSLGL